MKKIVILFACLFISIPILIMSHQLYKKSYYIEKYGFFKNNGCVSLDEWYNKTINNQIVVNKLPNGVDVRGNIMYLYNGEIISFYMLKKKDPSSYIKIGDTINKSKKSLLFNIRNSVRDTTINIKDLYYCEEYEPKIID